MRSSGPPHRRTGADSRFLTAFVEGGKITAIEMVSEDWWQGTAQDGSVGVFPGTQPTLHFVFLSTR